MFRIDLFSADDYLLLTPQLGGMSRILQAFLLIAFLAGIVFALWRIYQYELKFITRKAAVSLLALRCVVITLIFFVVAFKPTLRHTTRHVIPSRVLIAIDRSDSMSITDSRAAIRSKNSNWHGD